MNQSLDRRALEKLSVRELRRQAAIHNVQLTQIAAAVEKEDLIKLIIAAGPVRDTYDVSLGVKVHSAASIANGLHAPKPKKKEKKKKRSSSSSSSASSGRNKSRKKRSRSRKRTQPSPPRKKRRGKSRSPSLVMLLPPPAAAGAAPLRALPSTAAAAAAPPTTALARRRAAAAAKASALKALPPIATEIADEPRRAPEAPRPSAVQAGMAAAAAMGFNVLPKAPAPAPAAPAPGLRPTVNSAARGALGAAAGSRICISYLCHARCDLGASCPEAHVIDPEEEMRVRARFKEQECHLGADCTRHGCLFRHPGEKLDALPP